MSRRDEAVEAMAEAMDTAYNPDRYPIMAAMFRDYADAGLDAALASCSPPPDCSSATPTCSASTRLVLWMPEVG